MSVPDWWEFLLLALAAWRTFSLLAEDTILDQPRRYFLRLGKQWEKEGDAVPKEYREKYALFITCPRCLGFWLGLIWLGAWWVFPHATLVAAVVMALNVPVIALAKVLSLD